LRIGIVLRVADLNRWAKKKMRDESPKLDYESAVLAVLAYEFEFSDRSDTEKAINQALREGNLGEYDEVRIAALRRFKDAIQEEVHRWHKSKYYTRSHGAYADLEDFDYRRMAEDYVKQFPDIPALPVERFVSFAIYLYYMR
jgi:hypothetical protein